MSPESEPSTGSVLNVVTPENVFAFARSVEEAAVIVIAAEPSKLVPLIARGVARVVAVPALPVMLPVIVLEKVLFPLKVLASARSVEEAAVTVIFAEPLNATPLIVREVSRIVAVAALPPMFKLEVAT